MNLEVRTDAQSALGLMEEVLSPGKPLAPEYPLVFTPGSGGRVVVAEEHGAIHSACAILRRELLFPDGEGNKRRVAVGLIGSVSTSEASRGQGLASSVLDLAERELLAEGCLFSLLWADSPEFYAARGYQPIGLEVDFVLDEAFCLDLSTTSTIRSADPQDYPVMHEMYCAQSRRVDRSLVESTALFSTPGMQVLLAEDSAGPAAYACHGRGHDLDGVVHEWAGKTDGVLACIQGHALAKAAGGQRGPLFMMSSAQAAGVPQRLQELGAHSAAGVLGMGKLVDPAVAATLLREACADSLEVRLNDDGGAEISCGQRMTEIVRSDWLKLLLPARADRVALEGLERRLQTSFRGLPWTPFLWGLDSI